MIRIAIDGPGGAGKSSVAKAVSKALGIIYVDTGALYRNIGLFMLDRGIEPSDASRVVPALADLTLELKFDGGRQVILLNGADRGDEIRTPEASMAASAVSAIPEVRNYLLDTQRNTAKKNSVVMDGRDIGTVILPKAEVKIFLTASPKARAERRYKELLAKGQSVTYEQVYSEMVERDKNDSTREVAPCVKAADAILVDNSKMTEEETVKTILKIVKKKTNEKTPFYSIAKVFIKPLFAAIYNIRVKGVENIPLEGGVLLCPNHIGAVDIINIGAFCPRQITALAKKELFSVPVLGQIIKWLGAVKLDRGGSDVGAIKTAISVIESGRTVTIFPQGHRYPGVNPATTEPKDGASLIAYRAKCDVIPVAINMKGAKYSLFRRTEITFGKPLSFSDLGFSESSRPDYAKATERIFGEICALSDFSALPAYDPSMERKKKSKKRGK